MFMNLDLDKGGRAAIERMIDAYGCGTKTALAELLGISKGTLSNRYLRDTFPADYVIQCALETGASLNWLATGEGAMFDTLQTDLIKVAKRKIINGKVYEASYIMLDKAFIPNNLIDPFLLEDDEQLYLIESSYSELNEGEWLVSINKKYSLRRINLLPKNKIVVSNKDSSFECETGDIETIGYVKSIYKNIR
ncbi:hypothetical protein BHU62_01325 [Serratia marcescens]|uniref:Uncharacterized protein n=2 Tax=Serratia marcescens TaxID=615 RepID=A0A1Q4P6H9_SERMA|nr:hypothetical protein BHU62_01325 [Serratia marcescens]